jgi:hypothetical protein
MKHADRIYQLLKSAEEENLQLAFTIINKHLTHSTVLGFAAMFAELNINNNPIQNDTRDQLIDKMEQLHLETFNEPLQFFMVRDMFHLAMYGSYKSVFSLKYTHQAYRNHIDALYTAHYNSLTFNGQPDESQQYSQNK